MSSAALGFLLADQGPTHLVGQRLAEWLIPYSAKDLARLFPPVEPRTAKAWKAGNLPNNRALIQMVERWGGEFLEHLFAPVLAEGDLSLDRRLERLEREAASIRREFKRAQSHGAGGADHGPAARHGRGVASEARPALAAARLKRAVGGTLAALAVASMLLQADDAVARPRPRHARVVRIAGGARTGRGQP